MGVLMVFIDGIGIGAFDPGSNPFARFPSPFFPQFNHRDDAQLPYSGWQTSLDATMGVAGLPQSATGQTALLTGANAAKVQGRHLPGFPTKTLRELLAVESIFLKIEKMNKTATFANAFAPADFGHHTCGAGIVLSLSHDRDRIAAGRGDLARPHQYVPA